MSFTHEKSISKKDETVFTGKIEIENEIKKGADLKENESLQQNVPPITKDTVWSEVGGSVKQTLGSGINVPGSNLSRLWEKFSSTITSFWGDPKSPSPSPSSSSPRSDSSPRNGDSSSVFETPRSSLYTPTSSFKSAMSGSANSPRSPLFDQEGFFSTKVLPVLKSVGDSWLGRKVGEHPELLKLIWFTIVCLFSEIFSIFDTPSTTPVPEKPSVPETPPSASETKK